jgi:pyruvate formate lyase activating enzyme
MNKEIYVSNIQRFSLDDGDGIRTTVFFEGCNLSCKWCHNPECIDFGPALQFKPTSCTLCGKCQSVCEQDAHTFSNGQHEVDRSKCVLCGKCAEVCENEALKIIGTKYSPDEIMEIILKDEDFYRSSGGGVTFSGGEPMLALPLLRELLVRCREHRLRTAVDTAGNIPFEQYAEVLPYTDVFLIDLKLWDEEKHRRYTGASNVRIRENIRKISEANKRIVIRIPVIGSVNDDLDELGKMADFLKSIPMVELVQLLPYHQYGVGKYALIGRNSEQDSFYVPDSGFMEKALELFRQKGINASF